MATVPFSVSRCLGGPGTRPRGGAVRESDPVRRVRPLRPASLRQRERVHRGRVHVDTHTDGQ